jgi:hypothetical protein
LLTGDEPIVGADAGVRDFWAWTLSDFRTNTVGPMLADFLVARALEAANPTCTEWDAHDVETPDGVEVEVRSAAYVQSCKQVQLSKVVFSGLNARTWTSETDFSAARSCNADVHVFELHTAKDHASCDALDLGQWSFWVASRADVEATGQRSLGLTSVKKLAGPQ